LFEQHFVSDFWGAPGSFKWQRRSGGWWSGSQAENEAVESHAKAAEEKEGRAVLRHEWKDGGRQRYLKGSGVAGSEIVNDAGQKHVKKSAANLVLPVRTVAAGQLHLRNRFAAKGALR